MMTTPREASGPASGGSTKSFAGGSGLVSGITWVSPHSSDALCAAALTENSATAVADSSKILFELARFIFSDLFF
jgi:dihydrodipicolinate synthase/N-acetylneuraminate lyase